MTDTPHGRVAVVTGGGRGVGRAIALRLAGDGVAVAINYRRDQASAEATVADIRNAGGGAGAFRASVDSDDDVHAMADAVHAEFGTVDILVSNAGIASRGHHLVDSEQAELNRQWATHVLGTANLCRAFVPELRKHDRSDVVVVSSVNARTARVGGGPYMMAKVALEAYAATLAVEEMPHGLHVNVVRPGLVVTDMGDRVARAVAGVADAAALDAVSPYGRVCRPEDVADVVGFLVSPSASYLNAVCIEVNGGGSSIYAH